MLIQVFDKFQISTIFQTGGKEETISRITEKIVVFSTLVLGFSPLLRK